ncbi:hypothetical protein [Clostridium aminobutyricum]|uniref:Uncharacterized protein n=1 Tax=Clostridium aminobutyricum TaxID=33953 RepID=A0A939IHS7_CLOAM|nr:hypothetical protein [Clostridium aminobutyricum]MBN7771853.1 hypothetical protein [Clostridium aminobutyricum]
MDDIFNSNIGIIIDVVLAFIVVFLLGIGYVGYKDYAKNKGSQKTDVNSNHSDDENNNLNI